MFGGHACKMYKRSIKKFFLFNVKMVLIANGDIYEQCGLRRVNAEKCKWLMQEDKGQAVASLDI